MTTAAYPERVFRGRVSYIDPQVRPVSRTAKVRVELANPAGELRLGMYADVALAAPAGGAMVVIPKTALQGVGSRQVVYLVNPNELGKFIERNVRIGQALGLQVEVLSGLDVGDTVVAQGSFFLRAERERLGLPQASGTAPANPHAGMSGMNESKAAADSAPQGADVIVSDKGFEPSRLLRTGIPARVTFTRTIDTACATHGGVSVAPDHPRPTPSTEDND